MSFATIEEPKVLYGRTEYMPAWTPKFSDADLEAPVTQDGRPLGFTMKQMLPERRWAVLPGGELLAQDEFEKRYVQWRSTVVSGGRLVPISADNNYFDPKLIPVPRVERFVAITHDYQGKDIPIGFDPNRAPDPTLQPVVLKDANGNTINPSAPNSEKVARLTVISDLKERGILSAEQASSEMASVLLEPQPTAPPPPGFTRALPVAVEDAVVAFKAPCGFEARSKAGVLAHARYCDDCMTAPAQASAEESA